MQYKTKKQVVETTCLNHESFKTTSMKNKNITANIILNSN
jgi:hypothetical protein